MKLLRDVLIFQAIWLTAVLAGSRGVGWIGLAAASALVVAWADSPQRVAIWLIASVAAWSSDAAIARVGGVAYAHHAPSWLPSALWMLALWLNFAIMSYPIFGFLRERLALGAAIGAVSGPLAYVGAASLGAISIPKPLPALALVAAQFAIMVPLLIRLSRARATSRFALRGLRA